MGHRRVWIGVFLYTATLINYTDRIALSIAAKPIAGEFHLTPVDMGYLFSSFLWTYTLCLVPIGFLVDRIGSKSVAGWGIALWSAATLITGLSTGYVFMLVSRMVMGAGESTSWPACNRVIREWFPASERGIANAVFGAGAASGPALGSVLVAMVVSAYGWRAGFFVAGAIGFIWLVGWLLFFGKPESVSWLGAAERQRILAERDGAAGPVTAVPPMPFFRLLGQRSVWGLFLSQGCVVYGAYMLITWMPSYLQTAKGLSLLSAGLTTAVPFGTAAVLYVVLGWVSDRLLSKQHAHNGHRRLMVAAMLTTSAVVVTVPLLDNLWAIIAVLTLSLATGGAASACNFALVSDLVRNPADIGKVVAITALGGNAFGMLGPIVTGYVVSATGGFGAAFVSAGVLAVAGSAISLALSRQPIATGGPVPGAAVQPA
jgi:ACS family glucarate transporter-like MFS transporter